MNSNAKAVANPRGNGERQQPRSILDPRCPGKPSAACRALSRRERQSSRSRQKPL